ncbi:MAG: hypothetical protein ACI9GK_003524, partial [Devosia sp.]
GKGSERVSFGAERRDKNAHLRVVLSLQVNWDRARRAHGRIG